MGPGELPWLLPLDSFLLLSLSLYFDKSGLELEEDTGLDVVHNSLIFRQGKLVGFGTQLFFALQAGRTIGRGTQLLCSSGSKYW